MARIDSNEPDNSDDHGGARELEKRLKLKVDLRLCTIGGLLCSLNLIDSGIISSAAVTSMLSDLQLDQGNRYSLSILIFTVSSVCFQLPATIAVRLVGPRIFFTIATICFGLITLVGLLFFQKKSKRLGWGTKNIFKSGHCFHPHLETNDHLAGLIGHFHGKRESSPLGDDEIVH